MFTATFTPPAAGDYIACGYDQFSGHTDAPTEYTAEFTVTKASGGGTGGGATACVVPRLLGKPLAAAERATRAAHCSVGKVSKRKGNRSSRGKVVSESPRAGSRLPAGAKIRLVVGR